MPYSLFEKLPEEKQLKILRGAMEEFAANGFEGASTNRIVKEVGIAKGSLFNYFRTKDELFLYTAEHTLKQIVPVMLKNAEKMSPDIFVRLRQMTESFIDIYIKTPLLYRFFLVILEPGARDLMQKLLARNSELFSVLDLFSGIDTTGFRVEPENAFTLIRWIFAGIKLDLFELQSVKEDPARLKKEFLQRLDLVFEALRYGICQ